MNIKNEMMNNFNLKSTDNERNKIKWYNLKSLDKLSLYIKKYINKIDKIENGSILNKSSFENILFYSSIKDEKKENSNCNDKNSFNQIDKNINLYYNDLKKSNIYYKKMKNLSYLIIITIWSRYLDLIVKVKFGGFIFFSSFLMSIYNFNKYYDKYVIYKELEIMSKIMNVNNVSEVIERIILEDLKTNKYSNYSKNELSKFWNEPMAWH